MKQHTWSRKGDDMEAYEAIFKSSLKVSQCGMKCLLKVVCLSYLDFMMIQF